MNLYVLCYKRGALETLHFVSSAGRKEEGRIESLALTYLISLRMDLKNMAGFIESLGVLVDVAAFAAAD